MKLYSINSYDMFELCVFQSCCWGEQCTCRMVVLWVIKFNGFIKTSIELTSNCLLKVDYFLKTKSTEFMVTWYDGGWSEGIGCGPEGITGDV